MSESQEKGKKTMSGKHNGRVFVCAGRESGQTSAGAKRQRRLQPNNRRTPDLMSMTANHSVNGKDCRRRPSSGRRPRRRRMAEKEEAN